MFFLTPSTGVNVGQILSASLFVVVSVVETSSELMGALVVFRLTLGFISTE
jgi:hypothetical protein